MNEPTNSRGETWEEFVARKAGGKPKDMTRPVREGLPPDWEDKTRKRASGQPPDFEAQEETAKAYATLHGRMWNPQVVDVKRGEGGAVVLLLKDRKEDWLMLVLEGLEVTDIGTRTQFRTRKEVVT